MSREVAADVRDLSVEAQVAVRAASLALADALPAELLRAYVERWAVSAGTVLIEQVGGRLLAWADDTAWVIDLAAGRAAAYRRDGTVATSGTIPDGLLATLAADPNAN